jgi:Tfp pilus assembly protein PilZ
MTESRSNHSGVDKRKHRRVLVVRPIQGRDVKSDFSVHLMNISLSGAQIYASQNLEIGNPVYLELPAMQDTPQLTLKGKIMWVHRNPMEFMGRYAYGLQFEELTPEITKFLEQNFYLGEKGGLPSFLSP